MPAEDTSAFTPARVEAIALAIVQASPLDALERISGPALTALVKAVLDPDRRNTSPS